jgi:hypothetical protein
LLSFLLTALATGGLLETSFAGDSRLFKVIVVTCNDSLDEMVDSTVTINNEQKETITGIPAYLVAKNVTEADLCGIGGASYGNVPANPNLDADIELPDVAPLFP